MVWYYVPAQFIDPITKRCSSSDFWFLSEVWGGLAFAAGSFPITSCFLLQWATVLTLCWWMANPVPWVLWMWVTKSRLSAMTTTSSRAATGVSAWTTTLGCLPYPSAKAVSRRRTSANPTIPIRSLTFCTWEAWGARKQPRDKWGSQSQASPQILCFSEMNNSQTINAFCFPPPFK